ncbi:MAG: endolytic transglycosylase MltG [Clostridia bacterium]|nr:endolytic transglycosylase MltG [Clostridia bacterium]
MDNRIPGKDNDNVEYRINSNNKNNTRTGQGTGSAYEQRKAELERRRQAQNRPRQLTPEQRARIEAEKARVRRHRKRVESGKSFLKLILVTVIVLGTSALLSYVALSCMNDVLAIHVSPEANTARTVTITEGMDTEAVIRKLKEAGVIKNVWFCKLAAQVAGYSDTGYIPGDYSFQRSQGLEKMLDRIKDTEQTAENVVTLTFPEGYTLDRILASLESNGVCSRESIESAMRTNDYSSSYKFLKTVTDKSSRFYSLEGYFYPDTYDFYLGESADSVIAKFLDNFASKWNDGFTEAAEKKNLSIDKVIIFASIVEREAAQGERDQIAGILLNRINSGMLLNCDSTSDYISKVTIGKAENEIARYAELYDTYKRALPVGPICNPGVESINAVLYASKTDNYYFMHDANGQLRTAKSLEEHQNNITAYGLAH